MDYNDHQMKNFELIGQMPGTWRLTAQNLKTASEFILEHLLEVIKMQEIGNADNFWEVMGTAPIYMLLIGFSLENLIKGLLISQNHDIVSDKKIEFEGSGHGLKGLFDSADVSLSTEEESFLIRVEEFVLWAGRYTLPKRSSYFQNREDESAPLVGIKTDTALFNRLYSRISELYPQ